MSNPAIRAQQQTPMSVVQVQLILTICLRNSCRATVAETLPAQRLISSVPPVKYQKTVDTGARHMMS